MRRGLSLSRQAAYAMLASIAYQVQTISQNRSITVELSKEYGRNLGYTDVNPVDLSIEVLVGAKGINDRRFGFVDDDRFVEAVLDLFHERRHVEQYCGPFVEKCGESWLAFSALAIVGNKYLRNSAYYSNPHEIDAVVSSVNETRQWFENHFPSFDVDEVLVDIFNRRFEEAGQTFALVHQTFDKIDDFVTSTKEKLDTSDNRTLGFVYPFQATTDEVDRYVRENPNSSFSDAWFSSESVNDRYKIVAALVWAKHPEQHEVYSSLIDEDWKLLGHDLGVDLHDLPGFYGQVKMGRFFAVGKELPPGYESVDLQDEERTKFRQFEL